MDWPASVALAQSVPELTTGTDWSYEVKLDGHRMILWRTGDRVRLQARSGRDVTAVWGDLALAGHRLPAGTVLDGEAVITTEDGRISFEAVQARAASYPTPAPPARRLAAQRPAHYIAFDALQLPSPTGDIRARPYGERRAALLRLLAELPEPTPIQSVSATTDRDTALTWYDTLHNQGWLRTTVVSHRACWTYVSNALVGCSALCPVRTVGGHEAGVLLQYGLGVLWVVGEADDSRGDAVPCRR
ncbi:hypothetical protein ACIOHS_48220 [Streptomyces sp. NPDC088253]|uniref:ATP-dependent DNA ligase n=1 Tax=Streptomyces sp. NPDC088253 TaxID=3365846 RepID=UPI003811D8DD